MPAIGIELGASVAGMQWVVNGYTLTLAHGRAFRNPHFGFDPVRLARGWGPNARPRTCPRLIGGQ